MGAFEKLFLASPPFAPTVPRSRGSTKRTRARPLGCDMGATRAGNEMAARVAILVLLAASRGLNWILEQPKGSLFQEHPLMQAVFSVLKCFRKSIKMGDFGAKTSKPTWLYSGGVPGS